jgi:branched-chain amino acid transport system permease protein
VFAFLGGLLPEMARVGWLPMTTNQADVVRYIVIGIVLMLIVIFRPQGILGNKREMTFVK